MCLALGVASFISAEVGGIFFIHWLLTTVADCSPAIASLCDAFFLLLRAVCRDWLKTRACVYAEQSDRINRGRVGNGVGH